MSELEKRFSSGAASFIPFIVAGHPALAATEKILLQLSALNPIAIELGVPFSDPTADGPVIQRAAQRALEGGTDLSRIFRMLRRLRGREMAPIILFTYYNPILQFGLEEFSHACGTAGVAGVLAVDLPVEASKPLHQQLRQVGIDLIFLVAPTTTEKRLSRIARRASGFIYVVSRTGVTGKTTKESGEAQRLVRRIRGLTWLPVAVGFGIATRADARRVRKFAEAAVVGSRLVAEMEAGGDVIRCARQFI